MAEDERSWTDWEPRAGEWWKKPKDDDQSFREEESSAAAEPPEKPGKSEPARDKKPSPERPREVAEPLDVAEVARRIEFRMRERTVVDAEQAIQEFPPDSRAAIMAELRRHADGVWLLERGRYFYTHAHFERPAGPARIRQRIALRREGHPPADPTEVHESLAGVVTEPPSGEDLDTSLKKRLSELQDHLGERDEIRISWEESKLEVVVTPQAVTLEYPRAEETPAVETNTPADPPSNDREPHEFASDSAPRLPPRPPKAEVAAVFASVEQEPGEPSEPPPVTSESEVELPDTAAWAELPEPPTLTETAAELLPTVLGDSEAEPEPPQADLSAEIEADIPPVTESSELGVALAEIRRVMFEQVELPPLAGGAGPLPERRAMRPPATDTRTEAQPYEPRREPLPIRPSHGSERSFLHGARRHEYVDRLPDFNMRRKARKLLRILARRFHLRLTPEMEAYLLEIMLAPKVVGGRKVYGLSVHREEVIDVMRVLWLQFGNRYAIRPRPPRRRS